MSQTYQIRPSEMYSIRDELAAWCFDRAIYLFGTSLENDLTKARNAAKNPKQAVLKQQRVMARWLGTPVKYRDPVTRERKTEDVDSSTAAGRVLL